MNPQVEAAVIAAVATIVSVGLTVLVAFRGFRATKEATSATIKAQHQELDSTLRVQTLPARFAAAADMLGFDKPAPVRLAGVYAIAGLADDWEQNRQTCIDVLCGYLRMRYGPDPGDTEERLADQEVRRTIVRVITAHLRAGAADARVSWRGKDLDFTGVVFEDGDFSGAVFSGGMVSFTSATFTGGTVKFSGAKFSGGTVNFDDAKFSGGTVTFAGAEFSGSDVSFRRAEFSGGTVTFTSLSEYDPRTVKFTRGTVDFGDANFCGSKVDFFGAEFSGATVSFWGARFSQREVSFGSVEFKNGTVDFRRAGFFRTSRESKETLSLPSKRETNETMCNTVSFEYAKFTGSGVDFRQVIYFATVDFRDVWGWNYPPQFDSDAQVMLPGESGKAPA